MASSRKTKTLLAWGASAVLVLAGGGALYVVRGALASGVDGLMGGTEAEAPPPVAPPVASPPPPVVPERPRLTYVEIEARLESLPEKTLALIGEGLAELPEFQGLDSSDPQVVRRIRARWQPWGTIWRNRTGVLKKRLPDTEDCDLHADLAPTCAMLVRVLVLLDRVPEAANLEEANAMLEEARTEVDTFLNPPEEEEEGGEGEEGEGEDDGDAA